MQNFGTSSDELMHDTTYFRRDGYPALGGCQKPANGTSKK